MYIYELNKPVYIYELKQGLPSTIRWVSPAAWSTSAGPRWPSRRAGCAGRSCRSGPIGVAGDGSAPATIQQMFKDL